ncbi:hypothetical protein [Pelagibius sp.]|uniref:hypothetical protein n=1 Tax=Pelagibius sp. TaxID=1931238 RepID=UPI0026221297|nr:hypothetical protein [Pelagibius sp.]
MPVLIPIAVIAGGVWLIGQGLKAAGEGVEDTGDGALKIAGAAAIGVGAWIAVRRLG